MSPVLAAILVTLKLAGLTTLILLLLGMPLAWWLARTRSRWRIPIGALVALPMVLPPTVLGFYLLLGMGPNGPIGQLTTALGLGMLDFVPVEFTRVHPGESLLANGGGDSRR